MRRILLHAYATLDDVYRMFDIAPDSRAALSRVQRSRSESSHSSYLSASNIFEAGFDQGPDGSISRLVAADDPDGLQDADTLAATPADSASALPASVPDTNIYQQAIQLALAGQIACRKMRLDVCKCSCDEQFLASVHCLRGAFAVILSNSTHRAWFFELGLTMMSKLLARAGRATDPYRAAYRAIVTFVTTSLEQDNGSAILQELSGRRVAALSFYDLVLDFTFLDALEDLEVRTTL